MHVPITTFIYTYLFAFIYIYLHKYTLIYIYIHFPFPLGNIKRCDVILMQDIAKADGPITLKHALSSENEKF